MAFASPAEIDQAARLLKAGRLVAFPTETVYGLGANALDADAVSRIYAVKRRPATSPLIVHVSSIEMARELLGAPVGTGAGAAPGEVPAAGAPVGTGAGAAAGTTSAWPETAELLARKFWPGPLTLVLPKPPAIPLIVTAGLSTVGLRMPSHPVALALIRAAGVPLAAPSANRFSELSPTTAEHVRQSLGGDVDYVLDGGPCEVGIESTVLSLAEAPPVLLRPGAIARAEIEAVIGPVDQAKPPTSGAQLGSAHPAPGMHARHYSPRTPLLLISNGDLPANGRGIYLQHTRAPNRGGDETNNARPVEVRHMPQSAPDYAARLYSALHEADAAQVDWIAIDPPPDAAEWEAVHDRLRRAAFRD